MDPLSIIASSIAIATPLTAALQKIRAARHAKASLLLLNNDVTEVTLLLQNLERELRAAHNSGITARPDHTLLQVLDMTCAKLSQLAAQIAAWESPSTATKDTKSKVIRWVNISSKVTAFHNEFRRLREQLSMSLAAFGMSSSTRMQMRLEDIFLLAQDSMQAGAAVRETVHTVLENQRSMQNMLLQSPSAIGSSAAVSTTTVTPNDIVEADDSYANHVRAFHHNGAILFDSAQLTAVAAVGIRTAQFPRTACTPWCSCICHQETRLRTPKMLEKLIGALFINCSGIPLLQTPCNERSCHMRALPLAHVTYFFPPWLVSKVVSFMMTVTPLSGPVASLKVSRTVPGSADIFTFAKVGDVEGMKRLFQRGLASPHDVHFESGVTPLHIAINHQHIQACKLLLQTNADPFLGDYSQWYVTFPKSKEILMLRSQSTAADTAWTKILSRTLNASDELSLRELFSETECIERRDLTVLHKIVLGLSKLDLAQQLAESTADVNAQDSIGRTALSMAVERSDPVSARLLLDAGADPTIASYSQLGPLHYASMAKDPACIELLVSLKTTQVDSMSNWQQTPLVHAVAYVKDERHSRLLLMAGADPNRRDRDGFTPLAWAAIANNLAAAKVLLEYKARADIIDLYGTSLLHHCVVSNRHEILDILAPLSMEVRSCLSPNTDVWHLITSHANSSTMHKLKDLNWEGMSTPSTDPEVTYLLQLLKERADYSADLAAAWSSLVNQVNDLLSDVTSICSEDEDSQEYFDASEHL
ncbi:uncharacterized protein PV09_07344 [Verruconis gallopava]|uniref:Uncharacterized protein n=1 Tax=Verruconis gallopava TaxID=253628 RepID=A0A0D2A3B3_9PEZI|nr:uncharacterized protein PV09_07344 [Verruconis gallopava]KIW01308.1 hypothetical protein PV09_07344 [Verruconis gallopava]